MKGNLNILCLIGLHKWQGCKCTACGKTRDQEHDWGKNCEKCSRCDVTRTDTHKWAGCKCTTCGKTRDQEHDWSEDCEKCSRCGAARQDAHNWEGCMCMKCNKEQHNWDVADRSRDGKCLKCGKLRPRLKNISEGGTIIDPSNPRDVEMFLRIFGGR